MKPEIFYLIFAIYDARNDQKLSENFYHIPNYDLYFNQLTGSTTSAVATDPTCLTKSTRSNRNSICNLKSSKRSLFSLDGRQMFDDIQTNSTVIKLNFLNKIKKVSSLLSFKKFNSQLIMLALIQRPYSQSRKYTKTSIQQLKQKNVQTVLVYTLVCSLTLVRSTMALK